MKIRKAVFPVGGWGTRFLPATKTIPKAMFPIIDKPIIHYAVEEAVSAGIEHIIFVITPNNQATEDYFSHSPELEYFLESKNKNILLDQIREISSLAYFSSTRSSTRRGVRGLGIAVLSAQKIVGNEPFAVVLPNDLIDAKISCMQSIVSIYEELRCPIFAVHRVPINELFTYGNIGFCELDQKTFQKLSNDTYIRENLFEVKKLIQKPDPQKQEHFSDLAIIGRYILPPEIFDVLEKLEPGYEGEVQLTDALEVLRRNGQKMYAYEFEGKYYDTRSKKGYLKAIINYALTHPELTNDVQEILFSSKQ